MLSNFRGERKRKKLLLGCLISRERWIVEVNSFGKSLLFRMFVFVCERQRESISLDRRLKSHVSESKHKITSLSLHQWIKLKIKLMVNV